MNPNLIETDVHQLYKKHENTDISVCFKEVGQYYRLLEYKRIYEHFSNDSEKGKKQVQKTKRNFVVETLTKKKFNFKKYQDYINISALTKDVPIEYILSQLFKSYPPHHGFNIYDSQLDEEFFKIISRLKTKMNSIVVCFCNIGNSLPKCIQHIDTQNLGTIIIKHDPINNKGLKKLFSLNLPQLYYIQLFNTNSTPDIWKFIQKLNTKRNLDLFVISVLQTQFSSTITKIIRNFFKQNTRYRVNLKDTYFYFNEVSKMQLKQKSFFRRIDIRDTQNSRNYLFKLTPPKILNIFEKMMSTHEYMRD